MPASSADRNPVEQLAEEFAERYRRGERPPLSEYVERYPQLGDEIRELFPALVVMEQLKPAADATGAFAGRPAPAAGRPPERVGDYRIIREIGRGGMGVVYEAEQVSLGRHVALKVLPPQALLNPTYLERFRREAKAAARLHHTNIVPVFGVGEEGGVHFYAMQFIPGEGLDRVLHDLRRLRGAPATDTPSGSSVAHGLLSGRFGESLTVPAADPGGSADTATLSRAEPRPSGSLSAADTDAGYYRSVARVALQVADALAYAHRQGVLHRDIKPSNLLLDAQGTVWVTDFGLAKADGADELTQTGDIVGTVRFMAPERFDGRSLPQGDVYGLGVTLYELLTLRPAFDDTNKARLMDKVLHAPAVPPRRLDARLPRDLETVVLKCLAKEPAERYPTAGALADDLRRFLADRPIRARRASAGERAWRWCRRNPAVAALLGAVALLLVLFAAGSFVAALWLNDERRDALDAAGRAETASARATDKLWEAYLAQAQASRWSGRPGRRFDSLDVLARAAAIRPSLALRNEAIACLALADLKKGREWEGYPAGTAGIVFDHSLQRHARSDAKGNISIRRVADDRELARLPGTGQPAWFLCFSPDGQFLAVRVDNVRSRVWDIEQGQLLVDIRPGAMAFAPDSSRVVVTFKEKIFVYELPSGKEVGQLTKSQIWPWQVAFDPSGKLLATCGSLDTDLAVQVHDVAANRVIATLPHPRGVRAVAWRPDGRLLAAACGDLNIHVWDAATWRRVAVLEGHEAEPIDVAFSHDGLHLASTAWDNTVRFWDPLARKLLLSCRGGFGMGWPKLLFSPDDRRLAFGWDGSSKVWLWETDPARECRTFRAHQAPGKRAWSAAISSDSRFLASTHDDGVRLWDLAANREVAHLPRGGCAQSAFFTAGDGGLVSYGLTGVRLRRVAAGPQDSVNRLRLGPSELLLPLRPTHPACFLASMSLDGRRIAASNRAQGNTIVLDLEDRTRHVLPGQGQLAISPDGRWVACWDNPFGESRIAVAEVATGEVVWEAPGRFMPGEFSPDGRWLAMCGDACRLWEVGSWRPGRAFDAGSRLGKPGFCAFSRDGKMLAIVYSSQVIQLVNPESGQEYATLASPSAQGITLPVFSPDGNLLAVSCSLNALQVWNLRAIRRRLAELGLDWDARPPPDSAKDRPQIVAALPLRVEVDAGTLGADPGQRETARRLNDEAWRLVTGAADCRDAERALDLVRQALQLDPENANILNTRGVVLYRNGRYKDAAQALEKSLAAGQGQFDAFDLYFLAMCHARLGDAARAKDCFDRAVKWAEAHKDLPAQHAEELKAFRAEAEAVLQDK